MNTKELEEVFSEALGASGFMRRKDAWYKSNEDVITLVNLQKSQWGGQYYVNLGAYIRELGNAVLPSEYECHIRVRLSSIAGTATPAVEEVLDLDRVGVSSERRKSVLSSVLTDVAVPFLANRSTLPSLRERHAQSELGPVLITKGARELLDGPGQQ